jgi:hypothetical protein
MRSLDVNGLTDTRGETLGVKKQKKLKYVSLNGKKYKSEAEYVKLERKGE